MTDDENPFVRSEDPAQSITNVLNDCEDREGSMMPQNTVNSGMGTYSLIFGILGLIFSATSLVLIFSPIGIITGHLGAGRYEGYYSRASVGLIISYIALALGLI